jgi:hypothetical protein
VAEVTLVVAEAAAWVVLRTLVLLPHHKAPPHVFADFELCDCSSFCRLLVRRVHNAEQVVARPHQGGAPSLELGGGGLLLIWDSHHSKIVRATAPQKRRVRVVAGEVRGTKRPVRPVRLPTQPATGTARSIRTRSIGKDRSSIAAGCVRRTRSIAFGPPCRKSRSNAAINSPFS